MAAAKEPTIVSIVGSVSGIEVTRIVRGPGGGIVEVEPTGKGSYVVSLEEGHSLLISPRDSKLEEQEIASSDVGEVPDRLLEP